jgi:hypothetical protein
MLAGAPLARRAAAQRFPGRPIRFIAPYAPGGGIDTTARLLAGLMGASLGQPLVVENHSGAGGALGAAELARSAPDGHTIMVDASAHVVNPALLTNLSFDDATAFAPISQVVLFPLLLIVGNAVPVRTVQEFVAHLRAAGEACLLRSTSPRDTSCSGGSPHERHLPAPRAFPIVDQSSQEATSAAAAAAIAAVAAQPAARSQGGRVFPRIARGSLAVRMISAISGGASSPFSTALQ